jgi:hypothetical protein
VAVAAAAVAVAAAAVAAGSAEKLLLPYDCAHYSPLRDWGRTRAALIPRGGNHLKSGPTRYRVLPAPTPELTGATRSS